MIAKLALENGRILEGEAFGAPGEISGEVVFNTSMSGYQEIFTDPSYCGQIVTLTYPLIGNYGVNPEDVESRAPQVAGVLVKEYFEFHSNYRSTGSLGAWLREHNIMAVQGFDTRMLTKMLRTDGAMRGILSTVDLETPDGDAIPIEERSSEEVLFLAGVRIAPEGVDALHPAFDVTPAELVTAIITEAGVARAPYEVSLGAQKHA